MLFAAAYKVYVGFSARRFTSDLKDAQMRGLIGNAARFNSVNRYMANPELTDALKSLVTASSLPLKVAESDFAVDSSGFSTSRFVRWYNKKYGREVDNRMWVKVHLMCGVHTKIVSSVEVSGWTAHDTNFFVPLVEATAEQFQLRDVSADKAYLSRKNLKAVEELGGTPFVPFKKNTLEPTPEDEGETARAYPGSSSFDDSGKASNTMHAPCTYQVPVLHYYSSDHCSVQCLVFRDGASTQKAFAAYQPHRIKLTLPLLKP